MRDLMFALAMLIAIPLAIARPVNAYYLWGWTAVMIPTSYFYGLMANVRLNFVFALLTLLLIVLGRVKWRDYQSNRVTLLYVLFIVHGTLVFIFSYPGNPYNLQYYELLVKLMAFCLLMPLFIKNRLRMHVMLLVVVFGLGLHGVLDGLKTLATAGRHTMNGPAGTMLFDRNHLSTALAMALPLIYYLFIYAQSKLARWIFLGAFCLLALAIMGGGSRGGFLALSVVGLWLIMTSRHKWWALSLVAILGAAFFVFGPEQWASRLSTIKEASEDESFMGRVIAWKISSALAIGNPLLGGGFHAVQVQYVWDMFKGSPGLLGFLDIPIPEFTAKAAHSVYFEIMGDMGFAGFLLFMGILLSSIYSRFAIKRMVARLGEGFVWARDMADMLMLSIIAYMTAGSAVSMAYFEVTYIVVMLMELLRMHVVKAVTVDNENTIKSKQRLVA